MRISTLLATGFAIVLLLPGCGGGGGSASVGAPSAASGSAIVNAGGIPQEYYPIAQGSQWAYDVSTSKVPGPYVDTITINGTAAVRGLNAVIFNESNADGAGHSEANYYYKDTRAFAFAGNNDATDWLNPLMVPYDEMRFDGTFSSIPLIDKTGLNIGRDLDNDGVNDSLDVCVVGTVEGYETLTTTAGSFSNTSRVRIDLTGTLKLSSGSTLPLSEKITEWRAPAVGMIKQTTNATVGTVVSTSTMDLRAYRVNGSAAGYFPPQTVLDTLAAASSDALQPGRHAVGSDGNQFLLVSLKKAGTQVGTTLNKWAGQIITADGTPQALFDLSPSYTAWSGEAAVGFDGTNYLVLTNTIYSLDGSPRPPGITAQRVSAAGVVIDAYPGTVITAAGMNPAVAFGAGTYLVAYAKFTNPGGGIYYRLVSAAGVAGPEVPIITSNTTNFGYPAAAFDGTNFVIAWETGGTSLDPSTTDIAAARVSPAGALLDGAPIAISTAPEAQTSPHIACDGVNCLVIWADRRNYPGQPYNFAPGPGDIYGAFVSKAGALINGASASGGIAIATGITANYGFPALAFTGSHYLLAWTRGAFVNNPGGPTGIYAARVTTGGTIIGSTAPGIAISGAPATGTTLRFLSMSRNAASALITWLNNSEVSGGTKVISGAFAFPPAAR